MLKWTRKRPTEPGWYWFKPTPSTPLRAQTFDVRIILIDADANGRLWCHFHTGVYNPKEIAGQFAGPLKPPE